MQQTVSQLKSQLTDRQMNVFNSEIGKHQKSTGLAYVLWFFLGTLGIHQFYLGKAGRGVFYLVLGIVGWVALIISLTSLAVADPAAMSDASAGGMAIGSIVAIIVFVVLAVFLLIDLFTIPRQIRKKLEEKEKELILQLKDESTEESGSTEST
jgi:hypothetical protein